MDKQKEVMLVQTTFWVQITELNKTPDAHRSHQTEELNNPIRKSDITTPEQILPKTRSQTFKFKFNHQEKKSPVTVFLHSRMLNMLTAIGEDQCLKVLILLMTKNE